MNESVFVRCFGKSPTIKVLDFFLDNKLLDFPKSEVARQTEVSRMTLNEIWKNLERNGIIKKKRVIGRASLYQLNNSSAPVKKLTELDFILTKKFNERIQRKEKIPALIRRK